MIISSRPSNTARQDVHPHRWDLNSEILKTVKKSAAYRGCRESSDEREMCRTMPIYERCSSFKCSFLSDTVVLQSTVHAFCSPCILNASTGKQSTVALLISICTPVAADERSKRMWRPNVFTNSCQLKAFWYTQTLLETAS